MNARAGWRGIGMAGPRYNDEIRQTHDILPAPPLLDFRERIGSNNEKQLRFLLAQFFNGSDGVILFRAFFQT